MLRKLLTLAFSKDRRRYERFSWAGTGVVKIEAATLRGRVVDVSRGGFLFRPTLPPPFLSSAQLVLVVKGVNFPATILRRSQRGLHCRFVTTLTQGEMQTLKAMLIENGEAELKEVIDQAPAAGGPAAEPRQETPGKPEIAI